MVKQEILDFVSVNNINNNSIVLFTISNNGKDETYRGKFEFRINGELAIDDEKLGVRIQVINNAEYMPYSGGLYFNNLINLKLI